MITQIFDEGYGKKYLVVYSLVGGEALDGYYCDTEDDVDSVIDQHADYWSKCDEDEETHLITYEYNSEEDCYVDEVDDFYRSSAEYCGGFGYDPDAKYERYKDMMLQL